MEYWDIYDEKREKTGRTIVRGQPINENEYHLVVHMWIINSNGEFLIQKRSSSVKSFPNIWATTGGSAIAGDDSYSACMREVYEEIGIKADMDHAEVVLTVMREDSISDVWLIKQDIEISQCKLQVEEVSEVKWATSKEIVRMIDQGKFYNYRYLEKLLTVVNGIKEN